MKILMLGLFSVIFILSISTGLAQDKKETKKEQKTEVGKTEVKTADVKETGKFVNTVCIVSHEEIDPKFHAEYKGKSYAFCCATCLKKFNKDPEKYAAKFEKESNKNKVN